MNSVICNAQTSGVQSLDALSTSAAFHLIDIVKYKTEVLVHYSVNDSTCPSTHLSIQDLAKAVWGSLFKAMK